jgi:hypothetical protein
MAYCWLSTSIGCSETHLLAVQIRLIIAFFKSAKTSKRATAWLALRSKSLLRFPKKIEFGVEEVPVASN